MLFIIKNILRIIKDYNITLVKIIFFELIYFIKGYKGFKFDFSNNNKMCDPSFTHIVEFYYTVHCFIINVNYYRLNLLLIQKY